MPGAPPPPDSPVGYAAERRRHNLRMLALHGTLDLLSARRLPVMAPELSMSPIRALRRRRTRSSDNLASTQHSHRLLLDDAKAISAAQAACMTAAQAAHKAESGLPKPHFP